MSARAGYSDNPKPRPSVKRSGNSRVSSPSPSSSSDTAPRRNSATLAAANKRQKAQAHPRPAAGDYKTTARPTYEQHQAEQRRKTRAASAADKPRSAQPQQRSSASGQPQKRAAAAQPRAAQTQQRKPATRQQGTRRQDSGATKTRRAPSATTSSREATRYNAQRYTSKPRIPQISGKVLLVAIFALTLVVGGSAWAFNTRQVPVVVDGQNVSMTVGSSLDTLAATYADVTPGRLLAVDGSVIDEAGGNPYSATIGGAPVADGTMTVNENDDVMFSAGGDITEEYVESEEPIDVGNLTEDGTVGAVHTIKGTGEPGVGLVRTGAVSGKKITEQVITPASDRVYTQYNLDTGGKKLIALTLDDGPWDHTNEVLDVLRDNGAKATFFIVGDRITATNGGAELVKREFAEGHQLCTHSFDHAEGSGNGVDLSLMSAQEQRDEISKGQKAISDVTGAECSKVIRAPGGNFPLAVVSNVQDLFTYEIGWTIDTTDWATPGADAIYDRLMLAGPGDIILMHDGGGDRSQTIKALRRALPKLKQQGYEFVTIDELLANSVPQF